MNITYLQITGRTSCGREIIAMAADDTTDTNSNFKQFMIAVESYAATNPL